MSCVEGTARMERATPFNAFHHTDGAATIKAVWSQQPLSYDTVILWAACCMDFFGFLRAGEFTVSSLSAFDPASHLTSQDIQAGPHENPTHVRLHLRKSQRDPFCRAADVYLGRSTNDICPVSSILVYIAVKGTRSGPLFIFSDCCSLSLVRLVQEVQRALSSAGIDCFGFTGHSFLIGAATTATARGIHDSSTKELGR